MGCCALFPTLTLENLLLFSKLDRFTFLLIEVALFNVDLLFSFEFLLLLTDCLIFLFWLLELADNRVASLLFNDFPFICVDKVTGDVNVEQTDEIDKDEVEEDDEDSNA